MGEALLGCQVLMVALHPMKKRQKQMKKIWYAYRPRKQEITNNLLYTEIVSDDLSNEHPLYKLNGSPSLHERIFVLFP